ncbi:hypothetical protein L0Y49_03125, partial [bacterium]|nr:hypothetical protein [bacterium]
MTNNIRFGSGYDCGADGSAPFDCAAGASSLGLADSAGNAVVYKRVTSGGTGRIAKNAGSGDLFFTDSSVNIESLTFYVFGQDSPTTQRPRVLITVRGRGKLADAKTETTFAIQTTVTKRNADPK